MGLFTGTKEDYYEGEVFGGYQFISIDDIITGFIIQYVGENKIIPKVRRNDVAFHAKRAMQEYSYDIFRTTKAQEIEVPPSLLMRLPHDYVNWVKLTWTDSVGLERVIYPNMKSSNPKAILQDDDYEYLYDENGDLAKANESTTWTRYKDSSSTSSDNELPLDQSSMEREARGARYGLDPQYAQGNGTFFIDEQLGNIHFSSNIFGKIVTLKYLSDGLAEDGDMYVHKFAEEAVYKWILFNVLNATKNIQEYVIRRYKQQMVATRRNAKIRLSNYKSEEMTQVMRGKSKQIKH